MANQPLTIFSIGHSNRKFELLVEMLEVNGITLLVDIRKMPGSRKNPQFSKDYMSKHLPEKVKYLHMPSLGGMRKPRPDSPNIGLENESFRAYADYMQTAEFQEALQTLLNLAQEERVVIMCAEAVPWRCHRFLVSDSLLVAGAQVEHIMSKKTTQKHNLPDYAIVDDGIITYR